MVRMRSRFAFARRDGEELVCGGIADAPEQLNLRIASVFVLLVASLLGAMLPVVLKPSKPGRSTALLYEFLKYFGSGVIVRRVVSNTTAHLTLTSVPRADRHGLHSSTDTRLRGAWIRMPHWCMGRLRTSIIGQGTCALR